MTDRFIEPPVADWDSLRQKLTEGERRVLESVLKHAPPEWELYAQPSLNGLRPDVVLLNPAVGIHIIEVKDGRLPENPSAHTSQEIARALRQLQNYQREITEIYAPSLGLNAKGRAAVSGTLVYTNEDQSVVDNCVRPILERVYPEAARKYLQAMGREALVDPVDKLFPSRASSQLMSDDAAEELRRWLREPHHSKAQRTPVELDRQQQRAVEERTDTGFRKMRGPAGSGKSLCIAGRAAHLQQQGKRVLVVSFNITLLNYLRDLSVRFGADPRQITWLNWHSWCKRVLFEAGAEERHRELWHEHFDEISPNAKEEIDILLAKAAVEELRGLPPDDRAQWDAILVDEGQDFRLEWWNALREQLRDGGEMLLAADRAQNIYGTDAVWTEQDSMAGSGLPGAWFQLEATYRIPTELIPILQSFIDEFLPNQPLPFREGEQLSLAGPCRLRWIDVAQEQLESKLTAAVLNVQRDADEAGHRGAWSDITLLSPDRKMGRKVVERLERERIKVQHTYMDDTRASRMAKLHFFQGNDRIKATTIHSYKGWESPMLVIGLKRASSSRDLSLVYTAMTRLLRSDAGSTLVVVSSAPELRTWAKQEWPRHEVRGRLPNERM